jgi:hypothetical protein
VFLGTTANNNKNMSYFGHNKFLLGSGSAQHFTYSAHSLLHVQSSVSLIFCGQHKMCRLQTELQAVCYYMHPKCRPSPILRRPGNIFGSSCQFLSLSKFALDNTKVSKKFRQSKFSIDQQAPSDWLKSDVFRGANFAS